MRRLWTRIIAAFDGATASDEQEERIILPPSDAGDFPALAATSVQDEDPPSSLRLKTTLRLPRRLDVPFDRYLVGEGWHGCEMNGNMPFRWMGLAETATIWLAVDRSVTLACDLAIYLVIDQDLADQTRIAIGDPADVVAHEATADGLSFILPPAADHSGPTRITLTAPGLVPGADPRRLAIACSGLRVRPVDSSIADSGRLTLHMALASSLSNRDAAASASARTDQGEARRFE